METGQAQQPARASRFLIRAILVAIVAAVAAVGLSITTAPEAFAQEKVRRWFSLRELFAPRREEAPPRVLRDLSDLPRVKEQRAREALSLIHI